ncbi:hypothetical protein [Psychroserpens mesophilus]|uniref:hypothetical protein n=1 Tax=Psychroserpens mesophilus TaxID=325473 RepID=UPI000AEB29CF|nr:hypothetical protein [Psychroserpens mesophilus]
MKQHSFFKGYLIPVLVIMLICIGCEKDSTNEAPLGDEDGAFEMFQIMQSINTEFVRIGEEQNLVPYVALDRVVAFAEALEGVEHAFKVDTGYLHVTTYKGFTSSIQIDEVDENGKSLYRGAESGTSALKTFRTQQLNSDCVNKIENKKVLLFAAAHDDFYYTGEYETRVVNLIQNSDLDLEVTVLKEEQCTWEVTKTFDQYGMVVLDTHGSPTHVQLGNDLSFNPQNIPTTRQEFINALVDQLGTETVLAIINRSLGVSIYYKYNPNTVLDNLWGEYMNNQNIKRTLNLTSKGIRSVLPNLDNTIVFSNACYSGFNAFSYINHRGNTVNTDPIQPAWMSKNPIAYYGYEAATGGVSYRVLDEPTCKTSADSLFKSLFYDKEPTGSAHLFYGTTLYEEPGSNTKDFQRINYGPLYFKQYGNEDYCYETCENEEDSYFTASISGLSLEEFEAESFNYYANAQGEGSLLLSGRREADGVFLSHTINLRTFNYQGVGTYPVGAASESNEGWDASLVIHNNIYYDSFDPPTGFVTITEECDTYIKGVFSVLVRRDGTEVTLNGNVFINF